MLVVIGITELYWLWHKWKNWIEIHLYEWYSEQNKANRMLSRRNANFDFDITWWKSCITINKDFHQEYGAQVFPMEVVCIVNIACIATFPHSSKCLSTSMSHTHCYMWTNMFSGFPLEFSCEKKRKANFTLFDDRCHFHIYYTLDHTSDFLHWDLKAEAKNRLYLSNISCTCSVWRNNFHTYHATENGF